MIDADDKVDRVSGLGKFMKSENMITCKVSFHMYIFDI